MPNENSNTGSGQGGNATQNRQGTGSQGASGQAAAGTPNPDDALIADIDLSDVPEGQREAVKAKLITKAKQLQSRSTKREQQAAEKEREASRYIQSWQMIKSDPANAQVYLENILKQEGIEIPKKAPTDSQISKAKSSIDQMLERATSKEDIDLIKGLQQAIREESNTGQLNVLLEEIKFLKNELNLVKNQASIGVSVKIENQITELKEIDPDLIAKYEKDIRTLASKYPALSVKKLLANVAEENEYDEFAAKEYNEKQRKINKAKKDGSDGGGDNGNTPVSSAISIKKDPKTGRTDMKDYIGKIFSNHKL